MQKSAKKAMRGGFTLIEILVVLVIMGFLVAMVAPKLSGIVDSAVDTACDTNQQRMRTVLNGYVNQNRGLPSGLVNLVKYHTDATIAGNAVIPDADDNDKTNGKEFLSWELEERMKPQIHHLDANEALELRSLGIGRVQNMAVVADAATLALTTGTSEDDNVLERFVGADVVTDLPVFMIGVGYDGAAMQWAEGNTIDITTSAVTENNTTAPINDGTLSTTADGDVDLVRLDEGANVGRIVMGINNQGELVKTGMLEESGTCPGQIQRADQHTWGNYLVVLPRLSSTVARLDTDNDGVVLNAVAIDGETGESVTDAKVISRSSEELGGQDVTMFTTSCPEGHTWGAVADVYAISVID